MTPPDDNPYARAVFKIALASRGVAQGFEQYRQVYPSPALALQTMPFVSALDYAREHADAYVELDPGGIAFAIEPPRIIGENDSMTFHGHSRTFFVARLRDVVVGSQSGIVTLAGSALVDIENDERTRGTYRFELDPAVFSVEGNVANVITRAAGPTRNIAEAFVSLVHPQADDFGHWIWHQLPRLVAAIASGALPEIPILVDQIMPQSHFDALTMAIGTRNMPVIAVPRGESVSVERAWYVCAPFFTPALPVATATWTWEHIATPPERFVPVLEAMSHSADAVDRPGRGAKIFLGRRPYRYRRVENIAQIEDVVRSHGFEIVYPEELPFLDQAAMMRDARYIAGPQGSAFFLSFYAKPGTKIFIIDHPFTSLTTVETAPQRARGMDVTFMTGPVVNANDDEAYPSFGYKVFADYTIDPELFAAVFATWCAD